MVIIPNVSKDRSEIQTTHVRLDCLTLTKKVLRLSETSGTITPTIRRNISEEFKLQQHHKKKTPDSCSHYIVTITKLKTADETKKLRKDNLRHWEKNTDLHEINDMYQPKVSQRSSFVATLLDFTPSLT